MYNNLEEWCNDENNEYNEYIGRKGIVFINNERYPKENSKWHNQFKIKDNYTREMCIMDYKTFIIDKIINENLMEELSNL